MTLTEQPQLCPTQVTGALSHLNDPTLTLTMTLTEQPHLCPTQVTGALSPLNNPTLTLTMTLILTWTMN